jgi:hypothetical protein
MARSSTSMAAATRRNTRDRNAAVGGNVVSGGQVMLNPPSTISV